MTLQISPLLLECLRRHQPAATPEDAVLSALNTFFQERGVLDQAFSETCGESTTERVGLTGEEAASFGSLLQRQVE